MALALVAGVAACLAAALGLPDATTVASDAQLDAVTELTCDGQTAQEPIRSLAGIERLSALDELDAPRNEIGDLAPLASWPRLGTLFDLGLSQNPVSDLTPLAGMTTLDASA